MSAKTQNKQHDTTVSKQHENTQRKKKANKPSLADRLTSLWEYCWDGVWSDTRNTRGIRLLKTINLSARSFLDRGLQTQAAAMTYKTVLAIVPALALVFAIGKGFNSQGKLQEMLLEHFPAQTDAMNTAFEFVDHYLAQSSEGIFVGVGIVFLLYTLISLLGSVEDAFNRIWGIKQGRSILRKITDYTSILLLLPVLLICSSGITVLMSSTLETLLPFEFISPAISYIVDFLGLVILWVFFMGAYLLIPNTRVKWRNALPAGILAGTCFYILQWLFVSGQLYVTKYNAIYGSFAFLPLLLLWLQLVWVITLAGGVVCYSAQNIGNFSFSNKLGDIAPRYRHEITLGIMTLVVKGFENNRLIDRHVLVEEYGLPVAIVDQIVNELENASLVNRVLVKGNDGPEIALAPAMDCDLITARLVQERLEDTGTTAFIPTFDRRFNRLFPMSPDTVLKNITIPL